MRVIIEYFSRVFRNVKTIFSGIVQTIIDICHALEPDKELRQKGRQALKESCIQFGKDFVLGLKQGWYNVFGKK